MSLEQDQKGAASELPPLGLEEEAAAEADDYRFMPTPLPTLDATDTAIARALEHNGRISVLKLSQQLNLSRATVSERLARLIEQGVIKGFHARLDYRRLGYPLTVFVGFQTVQGFNVVEVLTALKQIREVEEVHTVTGRVDMLVKLRARSTEHLQYILTFKIQAIAGIGRGETMVVLSSGLEWAPVGSGRQVPADPTSPTSMLESENGEEGPSPALEEEAETTRARKRRPRTL